MSQVRAYAVFPIVAVSGAIMPSYSSFIERLPCQNCGNFFFVPEEREAKSVACGNPGMCVFSTVI